MARKANIVLARSGRKRSGKTTAATRLFELAKEDGLQPMRMGFADPIKSEVAKIFGPYKEEDKAVIRPVYQAVGEAMKTLKGKDTWIKRLDEAWEQLSGVGYNFLVIDDLRFPFEADWVRSMGGQIWKVLRDNSAPSDTHVSETSVKHVKPDWTILNSGTEDVFMARVTNTYEYTYRVDP